MKELLQILNVICSYLGAYNKKKVNILIFSIIGSIFSTLEFLSVGATSAAVATIVTGVRYFVFIFKDKYKTEVPLIVCLMLHLDALLITMKTETDIIPSALVIIGCLLFWYYDNSELKLSLFIINIFWIFYYMICGLYITAANVVIQNILTIIAYYRICKEKERNNLRCTTRIIKIKS